jgi:hypothetical protein
MLPSFFWHRGEAVIDFWWVGIFVFRGTVFAILDFTVTRKMSCTQSAFIQIRKIEELATPYCVKVEIGVSPEHPMTFVWAHMLDTLAVLYLATF